jgi:hypothetical protein
VPPNNGTKRGRGGGTRRSGEREEKKKRKEKGRRGEKKKKKRKLENKRKRGEMHGLTNKTAKPSGAGTRRPWPTAGCGPLLLTSA